jgi:hypothetical protein
MPAILSKIKNIEISVGTLRIILAKCYVTCYLYSQTVFYLLSCCHALYTLHLILNYDLVILSQPLNTLPFNKRSRDTAPLTPPPPVPPMRVSCSCNYLANIYSQHTVTPPYWLGPKA